MSIGEIAYKHGLSRTWEYGLWITIRSRCLNKNNKSYKDYGERGIKMYEPWINDVKLFIDYIKSLPNSDGYEIVNSIPNRKRHLSLDRINNNGNYEPGNLRWTTRHIQACNSRKNKNNTTGFIGVRYQNGYYYSSIVVNYQGIYLGCSKELEKAVEMRNNYIKENNLSEYKIQ